MSIRKKGICQKTISCLQAARLQIFEYSNGYSNFQEGVEKLNDMPCDFPHIILLKRFQVNCIHEKRLLEITEMTNKFLYGNEIIDYLS
jgi:hypothetical protein